MDVAIRSRNSYHAVFAINPTDSSSILFQFSNVYTSNDEIAFSTSADLATFAESVCILMTEEREKNVHLTAAGGGAGICFRIISISFLAKWLCASICNTFKYVS